jgi:phosphoglycerol transferase MdoB-like AlkP superfamily enzyme
VDPPVRPTRTGSASGWLGPAHAQFLALLRDPFYFLTVGLLFLKSLLAILLINNPDHSALDLYYRDSYDTSPVIFVSFIAIPVSLGFLLRGRSRFAYYLALDGALSLLMIGDIWYFRAYSTFLSFLLWQQVGNLRGLWSSIFALSRPVDLLFLADLAVLVPVVLLSRRLYRRAQPAVVLAALLPLVAIGCLWVKHRQLDANGTVSEPRFVEPCWEARQTINFQSPLGFHVLDFAAVYLRDRSAKLTSAQREEIRSWFAAKREGLPDNHYKGMLKGRNLVVVQVESLEAFVIGNSVAGQEITPVLNGLLPSSLYFPNIYDQAHEGLSSDSDLMVNASVYPLRRGSTFFQFPGNSYNSIPRILRGAGYRTTIAMHPDPGVYWNWKNALAAIGFDVCLDMNAFANDEILGLGLSDGAFLPQAAARLREQPEPFLAFLVTLSSHAPFELPDKYCELTLDEKLNGSSLGTAFQCFRYTDRQIGVFLDRLRASRLLERSVVVFYGDHASVHRFFNDEVSALEGAEDWMRDSRCLVPLIIYAPGLAGERLAVTGGHIDIMPTLLYLLGVDEEQVAGTAMGRNLLNTRRDFAVLSDGRAVGADAGGSFARSAVHGLAVADLIIRSDYFKTIGYSKR